MESYIITLSNIKNEQIVGFKLYLLSRKKTWHCLLGIQVTKKASFKDKKIMDLIEIVELRNANSRTNGFSEHNGERTICYSTVYSSYTMVMIYLKWQNKHSRYTKTTNGYLMSGIYQDCCVSYIRIFLIWFFKDLAKMHTLT